jgi:hypothetical protein
MLYLTCQIPQGLQTSNQLHNNTQKTQIMNAEQTDGQFSMTRELLKASQENNLNMVETLLELGANPYIYMSEPVRNAISHNSEPMIKAFLDNGYNPNKDTGIAFKMAIRKNTVELLKTLLKHSTPTASLLPTIKKHASSEVKLIMQAVYKSDSLIQ